MGVVGGWRERCEDEASSGEHVAWVVGGQGKVDDEFNPTARQGFCRCDGGDLKFGGKFVTEELDGCADVGVDRTVCLVDDGSKSITLVCPPLFFFFSRMTYRFQAIHRVR